MNKFKLTSETKIWFGKTLFRIKATASFGNVTKGDLGGFVEKESNLSQVSGNAWVYGDAQVSGNAWVSGDAQVERTPVVISGLNYTITITDKHMAIGCEMKTFAEWRKTPQSEIEEKHGDGDLWKTWKPILTRIINLTKVET